MEWYLEPWFWFLMLIVVMIIAGVIQSKFKGTFNKTGAMPNSSGKSGGQIAREILQKNGIDYVQVVAGSQRLGDNFNPMKKVITLSPEVYDSASIAAEAVAAHEVGHAIQWHNSYFAVKIRNFFLPIAQIGGSLSGVLLNVGFMVLFFGSIFVVDTTTNLMDDPTMIAGMWMLIIAAAGLGAVALFQLITLPVEFNASARAKKQLVDGDYINSSEKNAVASTLNAAAMTYVVAVVQTLAYIVYILSIVLASRRG